MSSNSSALQQAEAILLTPEMLSALVTLLLDAIKAASDSAVVDNIIAEIQAFLPGIVKLVPDLAADISQAITELQQRGGLTDAQITVLAAAKTALDTQTDADIAAALAYAGS